jgi:hypothetical protein
MNFKIEVDDDAFQYLRLQRGSLDKFAGDRGLWHNRYESDLRRNFENIAPFLPERCWGMLDIGSGLGGIDVLLSRHYSSKQAPVDRVHNGWPYVHLLDGVDDPPEMKLHRETFNSMKVAKDFQLVNGLPSVRFGYFAPSSHFFPRPYDLVLSFGSWCFHYEPDIYLPRLLSAGGLHGESVVIVDVRDSKTEWFEQLERRFQRVATIATKPKWTRCVYQLRTDT